MIRITTGVVVCACVLVLASALPLLENAVNETMELSNPSENHSIVKRNIFLEAWEELKKYLHYFIHGWFKKSDDEEAVATEKGMKFFFDIMGKICEIGEFLKGNDPKEACKD